MGLLDWFVRRTLEDVDDVASRAVAAGAKVLIPVDDQFYGDRAGRVADSFGHLWIVATRKQDMSSDAPSPAGFERRTVDAPDGVLMRVARNKRGG